MQVNLTHRIPLRQVLASVCCVAFLNLLGCSATKPSGEPIGAEALHNYVPNLNVPEMQEAAEAAQLEYIDVSDQEQIPVRYFPGEEGHSPVILLHGLQSHSLWFVQSSHFIADLGIPVYAMDRRGSGLSRAIRGDMENYQEMVDDIDIVVEFVKNEHGSSKVHIVGHCFGAIPAMLYASINPDKVKSIILPTPGIHTHSDLTISQKLDVLVSVLIENARYIPVPLETISFTESEPYRQFIEHDSLSLKFATASAYYAIHQARLYLKQHEDGITAPVFMALAGKDTISDNTENRAFFENLSNPKNVLKTYNLALHILEFSKDKDLFFSDLEDWFRDIGEVD